MKKWTILLSGMLFLFALAGCGRADAGNSTGGVFRETYSGTVVDRFTEGGGNDWADCLEVDVGEEGTVIFTLVKSTEITGAEDVSVGDKVELECESYTDSSYHPVISLTVLAQAEE